MTGDIVNLRGLRKQKTRAQAETTAAANRALHGRTKAEKAIDATARARAKKALDDLKRDPT